MLIRSSLWLGLLVTISTNPTFAADPVVAKSMQWAIDGVKREALVDLPT